MSAHRTAAAAVFAGVVPLVLAVAASGTAEAHGAPTEPVSRAAACGLTAKRSPACAAAAAANGGGFGEWDNLRVAGVEGRDRQVIPDGKLCSAGIGAYKGLDLPRDDWPATTLQAGADFTLTYRSTIPHKGTFSLYLTKDGYAPAAPLKWADLEPEPFLTATDPDLVDGSYRIKGRLPAGRTGHHVLYTVWRNSDTPDTYYSCSDIVVTDGGRRTGGGNTAAGGAPGGRAASGATPAPIGRRAAGSSHPASSSGKPVSTAGDTGHDSVLPLAGAAALLGTGAVGIAFALLRRRFL